VTATGLKTASELLIEACKVSLVGYASVPLTSTLHKVVQDAKENSRNGPSPIGPHMADGDREAHELLGHL
jgi:hypothetical protein